MNIINSDQNSVGMANHEKSPALVPTQPSAAKRLVGGLLRKTGYTLTRVVPRSSLVFQHIPGWFSVHEAETLYLLSATTTANRILEIGHFLGRSTSAICEGIRDSGGQIEFNSYDLGFTNAQEFEAHYRRVHDTITSRVPIEYEQMVYSHGTTTTEVAKKHLNRFDLDRFVNLISGDFSVLDQSRYGFIFCDALHDHGEIELNLPHVIAASDDDCLWALHDMTSDNVKDVLRLSSARLIRVVDRLGIFRYRKTPVTIDRVQHSS